MTELDLFRSGLDTYDISLMLNQSEALTYNRLEQLRKAERLEASVSSIRRPVPYAGAEAR